MHFDQQSVRRDVRAFLLILQTPLAAILIGVGSLTFAIAIADRWIPAISLPRWWFPALLVAIYIVWRREPLWRHARGAVGSCTAVVVSSVVAIAYAPRACVRFLAHTPTHACRSAAFVQKLSRQFVTLLLSLISNALIGTSLLITASGLPWIGWASSDALAIAVVCGVLGLVLRGLTSRPIFRR